MRTEYNEGKQQVSRRVLCHVCGRQYHDSVVGECPEREGRHVCMYCCRMCGNHYRAQMGQGCRVKDRLREEAKAAKKRETPPAPSGQPPQEGA